MQMRVRRFLKNLALPAPVDTMGHMSIDPAQVPRQRKRASRLALRIVRSVLFIAVGVYVGFCLLLYLNQSRFVYVPETDIRQTPDDRGLGYDEVALRTEDGVKLGAWFVPAEHKRGTVLFCHGNAGNMSDRLDTVEIFHELGLNVFIFDYRGYGGSEGKPSEEGTYLDAEAAWLYVTVEHKVSPESLVIAGRSLGGGVASWLAVHHPPRMLILESTFTSMKDVAADYYPYIPARILCRFRYDTVNRLSSVRCPVLVIHSADDDVIPYHHGRELFTAANEPKTFLEIRGTHNDGFLTSGTTYTQGLGRFISRYLADTEEKP